jgi:hypothetical protein
VISSELLVDMSAEHEHFLVSLSRTSDIGEFLFLSLTAQTPATCCCCCRWWRWYRHCHGEFFSAPLTHAISFYFYSCLKSSEQREMARKIFKVILKKFPHCFMHFFNIVPQNEMPSTCHFYVCNSSSWDCTKKSCDNLQLRDSRLNYTLQLRRKSFFFL